jgi:hypothetical protein
MNATSRDQADRLIVEFLDEHDKPTAEDWRRLTEQYPQHAAAFVDAALVRAAGDAADASAEEYTFDEALANKTVSRALSKAHQLPSANLEAATKKVATIQGPSARRETAIAIGIGPYPALLNGILAGRTRAPRKVLNELERRLDVPAMALRELFARLFAASAVPAFKAGDAKPHVASEPATWEEAVCGLGLSAEETQRLLKFSEED